MINAHLLADFVVTDGHDDDDGNLFLNLDLTAPVDIDRIVWLGLHCLLSS
jgi:hypothetical protein